MTTDRVERQYRVTWFPYDRDHVTRSGSEATVRRLADEYVEFNPIIEYRDVQVTEWAVEQ